jgi:transposase, IS30 family
VVARGDQFVVAGRVPRRSDVWVSHETIYQSLFVQGRGELRQDLHRCLGMGRARCRPRSRLENRGRVPGMVNISDCPAEVEDFSPVRRARR